MLHEGVQPPPAQVTYDSALDKLNFLISIMRSAYKE